MSTVSMLTDLAAKMATLGSYTSTGVTLLRDWVATNGYPLMDGIVAILNADIATRQTAESKTKRDEAYAKTMADTRIVGQKPYQPGDSLPLPSSWYPGFPYTLNVYHYRDDEYKELMASIPIVNTSFTWGDIATELEKALHRPIKFKVWGTEPVIRVGTAPYIDLFPIIPTQRLDQDPVMQPSITVKLPVMEVYI